MSTFDHLRTCTRAEYDYFKAERKELQGLQVDSLYVAMLSLRKVVENVGAIVMPIQLILANKSDLHAKIFSPSGVLISNVYEFEIHPDDFIHTAGPAFAYDDIESGQGYIRDYNERRDGKPPEVKTAADVKVVNPIVIPNTNILVGV